MVLLLLVLVFSLLGFFSLYLSFPLFLDEWLSRFEELLLLSFTGLDTSYGWTGSGLKFFDPEDILSRASGLTGSMAGLPLDPGLGVLYDLRRSKASEFEVLLDAAILLFLYKTQAPLEGTDG